MRNAISASIGLMLVVFWATQIAQDSARHRVGWLTADLLMETFSAFTLISSLVLIARAERGDHR